MKLTKKFLAVLLSVLMVLSVMAPVMAEEAAEPTPPTAEEIEAAKNNLQAAVNRKINYAAYASGTETFDAAIPAAQAILDNAEAGYDDYVNGLAALNAAKKDLVLKEGILGAFSADNTAATMNIAGNGVIQMDWTFADQYPISVDTYKLPYTFLTFDLTLTGSEAYPVSEAFKTGNLVLRSTQTTNEDGTTQENNVSYGVATRLLPLNEGLNKMEIPLSSFTGQTGKMDWSAIERLRLYFDSTNGKEGPFSMKMENIVIVDKTPEDVAPLPGEVAAFRDPTEYKNTATGGNGNSTLPMEWITLPTAVDLSGKDLSKVYLTVDFTLVNNTDALDPDLAYTDEELFSVGYFRLRSADTAGLTLPDAENNVGYSIADLLDKGIIEPFKEGKNSVKIPLNLFNTQKGTMDWSTLSKFRMYFDAMPGLNVGETTLTLDAARIIDEDAPLPEGVLGRFEDAKEYSVTGKTLETPWIKTGKNIDATAAFNHTYLHVNMTLGGANALDIAKGFFRLRSPDDAGSTPPEGENNIGFNVANMLADETITLEAGDNDLWIPLSIGSDPKGEIDWTNIDRFRVYFNFDEEEMEATLKLNLVEIVDKSADVDPTVVGDFDKIEGIYTAENETALQTTWADANAPMDLSGYDKDTTFVKFDLTLVNDTIAEDSEVFKTGKLLLASAATPTETDTVGENSVSASLATLIEDEVIAPLASGKQTILVPLSAFETEKGEIDWTAISRMRFFIDSTNQQVAATSMTLENVIVYDSTKAGGDIDPKPPVNEDLGDVDGNGKVEANDALLTLQIATNKIEANMDQEIAADVDGNGKVEANDALLILQFATKKITSF